MSLIRLDKYLADMKAGTRSEVKEYIRKGRVQIDGITVKKPEQKVDIMTQKVFLDGRMISYVTMEYYMLNKPSGVLTATMDKNAKTVLDETLKPGEYRTLTQKETDELYNCN